MSESPTPPYASYWAAMALRLLSLVAVIFATYRFAFDSYDVVALWPAAGLMLVFAMRLGWAAFPLIAVAVLLHDSLFRAGPVETLTTARFFWSALANAIGAVVAARVYLRFGGTRHPFHSLRATTLFIFAGAGLFSLLVATTGTIATILDLNLAYSSFPYIGARWFLSVLAGALLFAPVLLTWSQLKTGKLQQFLYPGLAVLGTLAVLLLLPSITQLDPVTASFVTAIVLLPVSIYVALQHDTALVVTSLAGLMFADQVINVQSYGASEGVFLRAQIFELVLIGLALVLHALNRERTLALASLNQHRENLEATVEQRTEELLQRNHDLDLARIQAEESARTKSQFLANMSHEIRTPMNGVLGMTELILEGDLTKQMRDDLEIVHGSAQSLLSVLNDILDFSKIEAGKLELETIRFSPLDSLGDALKVLSFKAHEKDLELLYDTDEHVPEWVGGDPSRLRQIVVNLIGNAIKFTSEGEVGLRLKVLDKPEDDDRIWMRVEIFDSGIGISEEQQRHIFEAFRQADGSTTRKYGGTGLGLAISRELATRMGGKMWLESTPGEGSTFFVELPFERISEVVPVPEDHLLDDVEVAVVDDNGNNLRILNQHLINWDCRPALYDSGPKFLAELAQRRSNDEPFPGLVILDYQMPELDGFEVAEKLGEDQPDHGIGIMMLTSAGKRGDANRCREIGIRSYLTKPATGKEIRSALLSLLDANRHADEHRDEVITRHLLREAEKAPEVRPLRVLMAEDNRVNQKLTTRLLQKHGHEVAIAEGGEKALARWHEEPFDVILMDMQMPVMGGIEATEKIREEEKAGTGPHPNGAIPIIALTANALRGDRERCLDAGMTDYLAKPIQAAELYAALARAAEANDAAVS